MWSMVSAHTSGAAKRADNAATVARSKKFLESAYKKFVEGAVFANLQSAQLGGVPSAYNTIRSFVGMKVPTNTPGRHSVH